MENVLPIVKYPTHINSFSSVKWFLQVQRAIHKILAIGEPAEYFAFLFSVQT